MPGYEGQNGRQIIASAKEAIGRAGAEMRVLAAYDHLPAEHRARLRSERTHLARQTRDSATSALHAWADAQTADARRRLNAKPIGTAAEEARRNTNEIRIGRLVESARASGSAKTAAAELAQQADVAYDVGNLEDADVLSRAALELVPGTRVAQEVATLVQYDRVSADPVLARARHEIDDVRVVMAAAERDLNAAVSSALQDSARLASALGDHRGVSESRVEASAAGRHAKIAAALASKPFGGVEDYREPPGVVPGLPQDLDVFGVSPAPSGAQLPEPSANR